VRRLKLAPDPWEAIDDLETKVKRLGRQLESALQREAEREGLTAAEARAIVDERMQELADDLSAEDETPDSKGADEARKPASGEARRQAIAKKKAREKGNPEDGESESDDGEDAGADDDAGSSDDAGDESHEGEHTPPEPGELPNSEGGLLSRPITHSLWG
jgi:hypothetical protein